MKSRRRTATLVLMAMTATQAFVCAPAIAGTPALPCGADAMVGTAHDCCAPEHPVNRLACCDAPDDGAPAVPAATQGQAPRGPAPQLSHSGTALPMNAPCAAGFTAVRLAPVHGYRSTDLSTLNAVFLL